MAAALPPGSVPAGATPLAAAEIAKTTGKDIILVATHDRVMAALAENLPFFAPDIEVLTLPAWDCLPYDRASPNPAIVAQRLFTLCALAQSQRVRRPRIIVTTVSGLLQKLPPREVIADASFTIAKGAKFSRDAFLAFMVNNGYRRAEKVMEPGEFALRGSIIDLFPPSMEQAVRLDLFGDAVETIRMFDPLSQRSDRAIDAVRLTPVSEVSLQPATIARFRENYREMFGAVTKEDPLYEAISEGRAHPGMEHWLALFYERLDTLMHYAPDSLLIFEHQAEHIMQERWEVIADYYQARINAPKTSMVHIPYNPLPPDALYLMPDAWAEWEEKTASIQFSPFTQATSPLPGGEGGTERRVKDDTPHALTRERVRLPSFQGERGFFFKPGRNLSDIRARGENIFDALRGLMFEKRAEGKSLLFACYTEGSLSRLETMLTEHQFHVLHITDWQTRRELTGKTVGIALLGLEQGFETTDTLILSEQDVLGERIVRQTRKKKKSENFLAEAANFTQGELVVHREHGIGRFAGLVTVEVQGGRHDCLKLLYEGDDKLFIPVENIDLISRYGTEGEDARLDKLGGASWQARKARLKERIKLAAEALLNTAAERALRPGTSLTPPPGLYEEFCARFPYMETDDQARSIAEVEEDLHRGQPMDRLICGDVGFGKTEIAMRAAFIAASAVEGKMQVALICPTTLLARQHYKNFRERFDGLPVTIRQLSRLVTGKQASETRQQLAEGKIDIVIGTHALLAKSIKFYNLGLLIVDEEQHFGVGQKEKLKTLKADVHVLTLSATPIPRTLQMALSGVRELSLITTPPVDRLAIRSFVTPFDPVVVREAILRECHRGGKTFYVTPRIKDVDELTVMLRELVPEIKLLVAHGQIPPAQLDDIMNAFYDGKADVLLSTAIVESGIDIPTANTMIINRADRFGLSQLYQLRGRIGRGKTRAYAYFTLPHHKHFTHAALRRLEVMQTLDALGAGFSIASHDMDIRGFGNLLGEEQSGQVREVGIELYQQMLEEAIQSLKCSRSSPRRAPLPDGEEDRWSPQINLGMSVLIPESYVMELPLRLGLYRRAANLATKEDIESFAAELVDRFGPMPEEVEHLLEVLRIKLLCKEARIEKIDVGPKGAVLSFRHNLFARPEALLKYIHNRPSLFKLRPDQKLLVMQEWKTGPEKIKGVNQAVGEIARLAA